MSPFNPKLMRNIFRKGMMAGAGKGGRGIVRQPTTLGRLGQGAGYMGSRALGYKHSVSLGHAGNMGNTLNNLSVNLRSSYNYNPKFYNVAGASLGTMYYLKNRRRR